MSLRPRWGVSSGASSGDDRDPARRQRHDRLGVRLGHPLDGTDELEVLRPDRGDDGDVRPRDLAERRDLAKPAHAHLRDEHLGLGLEPADRERQADLVVLARVGPDRRRRRAAERAEDVLRRRLARRADDRDDARAALRANERGESGERSLLVAGEPAWLRLAVQPRRRTRCRCSARRRDRRGRRAASRP